MMAALTPEDYRALVFANLRPQRLGTEVVALSEALGRTLANDAVAALCVPPFDNSAMDGFAVCVEDFVGEGPWVFSVVAEIAAGSAGPADPGVGDLGTGDLNAAGANPAPAVSLPRAARIMTGAPMPRWADAVVKVEDTDAPAGASALPKTVTVSVAPRAGQNVRRAGEDLAAGATALPAGSVLGARSLSALASVGFGEVEVVARPRVAVLATGSELAEPGQPLGPGMIPDSNSTLIAMLVREAGGEPTLVRTVADTAEAFGRALPTGVDLIVTSGGVSMGAFDPVKEYGLAQGWTFAKVAMQPGKPQGHGVADGTPVLALPGNPVSVAVSFRLFVRPFLARLLGREDLADADPSARQVPAGAAWKSPSGRRQFVAARIVRDSGDDAVVPVHALGSGSHLVASLHYAQVMAVVPAEQEEVRVGDLLTVIDV
ncbi:molybdopterin molybdotransferase MoeA [Trueperella pecoris]|nr:gephyrin-like molybdotransferase Glp [Trueperella pecoris]